MSGNKLFLFFLEIFAYVFLINSLRCFQMRQNTRLPFLSLSFAFCILAEQLLHVVFFRSLSKENRERSLACVLQVILLFDLPIDTSKSSSSGKQQQIYCCFFSFESVDTRTFFSLFRFCLSFTRRKSKGRSNDDDVFFFSLSLFNLLLNVIHIVYLYEGRKKQNTAL